MDGFEMKRNEGLTLNNNTKKIPQKKNKNYIQSKKTV